MRPLIKGLSKECTSRSAEEKKKLVAYFRNLSCFSDLSFAHNDSDILKIVNATSVACSPKHTVLFKIGDRGHCFYVSLSGTAQLFIPNQKRSVLKNTRKEISDRLV